MEQICEQFKIKHHNSTPYRPKMNRAVEVANKNVKKIVAKMMDMYKDWHEKLLFELRAYQTVVRTSTGQLRFHWYTGWKQFCQLK